MDVNKIIVTYYNQRKQIIYVLFRVTIDIVEELHYIHLQYVHTLRFSSFFLSQNRFQKFLVA